MFASPSLHVRSLTPVSSLPYHRLGRASWRSEHRLSMPAFSWRQIHARVLRLFSRGTQANPRRGGTLKEARVNLWITTMVGSKRANGSPRNSTSLLLTYSSAEMAARGLCLWNLGCWDAGRAVGLSLACSIPCKKSVWWCVWLRKFGRLANLSRGLNPFFSSMKVWRGHAWTEQDVETRLHFTGEIWSSDPVRVQ